VLRELPSVLGAYVSEDIEGHPREIHLLVRHGPDPAALARDIRGLLEERLGIPVDQRVISIAQLARGAVDEVPPAAEPDSAAATDRGEEPERGDAATGPSRSSGRDSREEEPKRAGDGRPIFAGLESTTVSGHVAVSVRLEWEGEESEGTAEAVDTLPGRARAASTATLRSAVDAPWSDGLNLELDFASIVQALDGDYILVSVLAMSSRLGRRPLPLVGAHPVESDVESAAALAALKAINRVLSMALKRRV